MTNHAQVKRCTDHRRRAHERHSKDEKMSDAITALFQKYYNAATPEEEDLAVMKLIRRILAYDRTTEV